MNQYIYGRVGNIVRCRISTFAVSSYDGCHYWSTRCLPLHNILSIVRVSFVAYDFVSLFIYSKLLCIQFWMLRLVIVFKYAFILTVVAIQTTW